MGKLVLVVDDNRDTLEIVKTILGSNGYTVEVANGGTEALALLERRVPDLVILDVMMPEVGGMVVLEHIKGNATTAHIPVIMCTAKSQDADLLQGYQLGADYYITKPFTSREILYGVGLLLDQSQPAAS